MSFDFFDDIICINLIHRRDRRDHVQSLLRDVLGIPFRFYTVEKHPRGGMWGCFESHINIIQNAFDSGHERILIFEDDIIPTEQYSLENIEKGIDFMKHVDDWDLFYYGYFVVGEQFTTLFQSASTYNNNIIKYKPFATHSYCVNRHAMQMILANHKAAIGKMQIDQYYSLLPLHSYCIVPMLFEQKLCMPNDNQAGTTLEQIARNHFCLLEDHKVNYRVSYIVYVVEKYIYLTILVLILLTLIVVVLYALSRTNIRTKMLMKSR